MSELPRNGLFINSDGVPFAIVNGSLYQLEKHDELALEPGYYDDGGKLVSKEFQEDEHPRDEHGRWTDAGGGSGGSDTGAGPRAGAHAAVDVGDRPLRSQSIMLAVAVSPSGDWGTKQVELLVNPKERDVVRFGREGRDSLVRSLQDEHKNLYIWKSEDAIHGQVLKGLKGLGANFGDATAITGGNEWAVEQRIADRLREQIADGRAAASDALKKYAGAKPDKPDHSAEHREMVKRVAELVSGDLDYSPDNITYGTGKEKDAHFKLNGRNATTAGLSLGGKVTLFPSNIRDEVEAAGVTAHEIQHVKFRQATGQLVTELRAAMKAGALKANGQVKAKFKGDYPAYEALHIYLLDMSDQQYAKGDGASFYSAEYWDKYDAKPDFPNFNLAMDETLAEMSRTKYLSGHFPPHVGATAKERTKNAAVWRGLYRAIDKVYHL